MGQVRILRTTKCTKITRILSIHLTSIGFKLNQGGFVSLKVYNLVGNIVATLVAEYKNAGNYEVEFDASNLTSGVYLYKLQINDFSSVKRMTLMK